MEDLKDIRVVPLFTKVKKIKETHDIAEVNKLIKENWILLQIVPNKNNLNFILGEL